MNDWGALIDAGAPLLEWSDRQYLPQSAAVPSCLTVLIDGAMDAQNNPFAVPLDSKKKKKKQQQQQQQQQADESVHLNDRLVRKTPLLSHLFIMTINLPRQARDKHHEKLRKKRGCVRSSGLHTTAPPSPTSRSSGTQCDSRPRSPSD